MSSLLNNIKSLSKDSMIYGFGGVIAQLVTLITAPIITRILLPAEYGALALVQSTFAFFVMFVGLNLNSGVYFYFFDLGKDQKTKKEILSTGLFFFLGFGFFCAVLIWFLAPFINQLLIIKKVDIEINYTPFLKILSITLLFNLLASNFQSLCRMTKQPKKFLILTLVAVIFQPIFVLIFLLFFKYRIMGVLIAQFLVSILTTVIGFFLLRNFYKIYFSKSYLKLFLSYSMPQFPSVFINLLTQESNRFFLNYFVPLTQLGLFSISSRVAGGFLLFTGAFRMAWDPFALSIMKKEDSKETYKNMYSIYFMGFIFFGCIISVLSKPILMILVPLEYYEAYIYVCFFVFAYIYQGANNIIGIGISISKKTKYISYAQAIVLIVSLTCNLILIPIYGVYGALIALIISYFVQGASYYYFASKVYPIGFDYLRKNLGLLVIFLFVFLHCQMLKTKGIIFCISVAVISLPLYIILIYLLIPNISEKIAIKAQLYRLKPKRL